MNLGVIARLVAGGSAALLTVGCARLAMYPATRPLACSEWVLAVAGLLLGVRVVSHERRNAVDWLFLGMGGSASAILAASWDRLPALVWVWVRDWVWWLPVAMVPALAFAAAAAMVSLGLCAIRLRGGERCAVAWVLGATALFFVSDASEALGPAWLWIAITLALPAATVLVITRYGLYDMDVLIHRSLPYGSLTVAVLAAYVSAVAIVATVVSTRVAAVARAVVVVGVQPLRAFVQRQIDRYLYGRRRDPNGVMSLLGQRLESRLGPTEVLPVVVATIGESLKVPYVAIHWPDDPRPAAEHGRPPEHRPQLRLPLAYRGELVGQLTVAARSPQQRLSPAEIRALTDLARHAAVAAHAVRLTLDLQLARECLLVAEEKERRRLCRDLHDGVGPALAGMTIQIGAARALLVSGEGAEQATAVLDALERQLSDCTAEVRCLVRGLRPSVLDQGGLITAIQSQAAQFACHGGRGPVVRIHVHSDELAQLPAAVEAAALRIAVEGVTNAARHADAHRCEVSLRCRGHQLEIDVSDDGIGIDPAIHTGIGTAAMRERAAELGGTCTVGPRPEGGTVVHARIPIPTREA